MSFNAAALKIMAAKGLTLEDAAEIAEAMERPADSAAEKRRAWDRERKREKRETEKKSGGNSTGNPPDGFPNDNDILTPSVTPQVISNEITPPVLKPEHVVEVWNDNAPSWGLKPIRKLTPQRRRKLLTRIRENTIDEFTEAISAIGRSPFLRGENGRGWRADFDWMLEPKNFTKLTEGNYDR